MNIYIDTEFNGFGGDLISLGMVADDGREWYESMGVGFPVNPWVRDNVIPVLNKPCLSPDEFRTSFQIWITDFQNPIILADWYTDLVHFFSLFEGRDHAESIDFPCVAILLPGVPQLKSETPHNALSDAIALRNYHRNLNLNYHRNLHSRISQ